MAEPTSTYAETRTARGAGTRAADHAASTNRRSVALGDRSPALSRRVNEFMRRRGRTEPEQIPFFCECLRADCYELIWLTVDAYDERRTALPLVSPGHEHAGGLEHGGTRGREIRCESCGYGAIVERNPTRCPMCGDDEWLVLGHHVGVQSLKP
jgi:hypothetical protein